VGGVSADLFSPQSRSARTGEDHGIAYNRRLLGYVGVRAP